MSNLPQQSPPPLVLSSAARATAPPPPPQTSPAQIPWYRRSGSVTAMVAGILLAGPLPALPVLLIVLSGPVYARDKATGQLRRWDASTRWLVAGFAVLVTAVWLFQIFGRGIGALLPQP